MRTSAIAAALAAASVAALAYGLRVDRPEVVTTGASVSASLERTISMGDSPGRQPRFSADSRFLAVSNAAGAVTVLRAADWRPVRRFHHRGGATAVAFGQEGRTLYTAGYDGALRVWDMAAGRPIHAIQASPTTIWSMDVSPDGSRLATAGEDATARVFRLDRLGQAPLTLRGHDRNIWEVRFSPDGKQLATGSFDYRARVWDLATGKPLRDFTKHSQAIVGLDYRPDGRMIATSGDDSTIRLWRPGDGRQLRVIKTGNHTYNVDFSPDGRWLASAGRSRSALGTLIYGFTGLGRGTAPVHIWRVADGALVAALPQPNDVFQMTYAPDGRHVVTSDDDGRVRIWRITPR
ncbi:MAG TPA: WD40 repeat domain-containing protein [Sphingomicrobium sp.]